MDRTELRIERIIDNLESWTELIVDVHDSVTRVLDPTISQEDKARLIDAERITYQSLVKSQQVVVEIKGEKMSVYEQRNLTGIALETAVLADSVGFHIAPKPLVDLAQFADELFGQQRASIPVSHTRRASEFTLDEFFRLLRSTEITVELLYRSAVVRLNQVLPFEANETDYPWVQHGIRLTKTVRERAEKAWNSPNHSISFSDASDDHNEPVSLSAAQHTQKIFNKYMSETGFEISLAGEHFTIRKIS